MKQLRAETIDKFRDFLRGTGWRRISQHVLGDANPVIHAEIYSNSGLILWLIFDKYGFYTLRPSEPISNFIADEERAVVAYLAEHGVRSPAKAAGGRDEE